MYKIIKDGGGVVLLCHDCSHVERIDSFNETSAVLVPKQRVQCRITLARNTAQDQCSSPSRKN